MVSIKEAKGGDFTEFGGERQYYEKLFTEKEEKKASCIVKSLEGLTIQEADILLDKVKYYLSQSIFSPEI